MERNTTQRNAIRDAFDKAARPLGPQEALDAAQARVPGMGIATVYRTIKVLVEEGWLAPVALPGEPPRYELAHKHSHHHHHFHCRVCNRVYDVEGCSAEIEAHLPEGYRVESHQVVLYGVCPACSPKEPATGTPTRTVRPKQTHKHSHEHGHTH